MPLRHENLVAWQRADDLFIAIHKLTKLFPAEERYELSSQLRRAAYSVPANIVEGASRRSPRDRLRFFNIAESSLAEAGYCIHAARRLGYLNAAAHAQISTQVRQTAATLVGLIRSLKPVEEG